MVSFVTHKFTLSDSEIFAEERACVLVSSMQRFQLMNPSPQFFGTAGALHTYMHISTQICVRHSSRLEVSIRGERSFR